MASQWANTFKCIIASLPGYEVLRKLNAKLLRATFINLDYPIQLSDCIIFYNCVLPLKNLHSGKSLNIVKMDYEGIRFKRSLK
jgi:hypothetical protein